MVILRKLQLKDADGMLEWINDPEIQKNFREGIANKKKEDILNFIDNATIEPEEGKSVHYAITNEGDEYLGTISLKNMNLREGNAEYAISLRKCAQGRGIAKEATNIILYKAFYVFNLQRVYLNVLADNVRAIRFYEKCGFLFEGNFRKHIFLREKYCDLKWYAILKEDFTIKNTHIREHGLSN